MPLRFGEFTFDVDSRQLLRGDTPRHLSPKAFDLLRLLLENRPRALSKPELHKRLWPDTFVSDATLTSLVAEAREALGERASHSGFLRTVHRFGYAFEGTATEARPRPDAATDLVRCWIIWDGGQVALRDGEHLIGRDGDVSVWLESPTVSRHHARLRVSESEATIEDLESKNGTYLRGDRVSAPSPLADGDVIRFGSVPVTFRRAGSGASTETQGLR